MKKFLALFIVLAVGVLSTGCASLFKATKDKTVNTAFVTHALNVDSTPSADGVGLRFTFGKSEITHQSLPSGVKNALLVKTCESSAWYCASVKDRTTAITLVSDSPIAVNWEELMKQGTAASGEQVTQPAKAVPTVTSAPSTPASTADATDTGTKTAQGGYTPKQ